MIALHKASARPKLEMVFVGTNDFPLFDDESTNKKRLKENNPVSSAKLLLLSIRKEKRPFEWRPKTAEPTRRSHLKQVLKRRAFQVLGLFVVIKCHIASTQVVRFFD